MPKRNQADKEEQDFQAGIKKTEWFKEYVKEYGEEPDLNTKDYDYRSAWKAGVRPQRDPYDKNRYHWSSSNPETGEMLKSKEHPTAWKEEYMKRTGKNPDEVGITKEQAGMAKGGAVKAKLQTKKLLQEGGMLQEGGTVDPVSGNDVPVGSMQEEVRDDIPAKLSEGEFVFPADVVRYIGLERLMQMRQAAKEGLKKMEDMGQMSNADEATEEDDGEFESQLDEIFGGAYLEVIWSVTGGQLTDVLHIDYTKIRSNTDNTQFWYKKDWNERKDELIPMMAFNTKVRQGKARRGLERYGIAGVARTGLQGIARNSIAGVAWLDGPRCCTALLGRRGLD